MRRLRDFQPVRLQSGLRRVEATVLAVADGVATLVTEDPATSARVNGAGGVVTLQFDHGGVPVVLAGRAVGLPDGLVYFTADDAAAAPEPRRHPRLPIRLDAEVITQDGEAVDTETLDVSEGGMRVRAPGLTGPVAVTIRLPNSGQALSLSGQVVRSDAGGSAIRFDAAAPAVVGRLRDIVMTIRRARTRALG